MGTVYAIANQKGGVGKTTTAVNVAACIAEAGYETLLVDVDPQGNATVGLGVDRNGGPGLYDVLGGDVAALDAVRPTGIDHLSLIVSTPDLAGATMELPRLPGSETRLRDALAGVRERFAFTLLDCPPSLGPLTVNALVAADRVIVPVQTEYFALEGLAGLLDTLSLIQRELNPRLTVAGMLLTMHDQPHEARPGRRARGARALPGARVRHRDPAQRPPGRGAELRPPRHPSRPALRRLGGLLRAGQGGGLSWLSATRGMGRGLSALLAPSGPEAPERETELRHVPVELVTPNPRQPRRDFDEGALVALAESLRERGVLQPVLVRPVPGGSYELIAGERRWRAARLAGFDTVPAVVRMHDDAESLELALIENMAREDLNPVEEARACALLVEELGLTREDVGRRVGRSRVAVSNLLRLLDLPDEVLDLLAAGHLSEGHGRALLTASDHDARRRLARTAVQEGWSVRQTEARARDTSGRRTSARAGANGCLARPPPGPGRGRSAASPTRSAACSEPTSAWHRAATAIASSWTSPTRAPPRRSRNASARSSPPESALGGRYDGRRQRAISSVG